MEEVREALDPSSNGGRSPAPPTIPRSPFSGYRQLRNLDMDRVHVEYPTVLRLHLEGLPRFKLQHLDLRAIAQSLREIKVLALRNPDEIAHFHGLLPVHPGTLAPGVGHS